ncbi:hypothetical protein K435DRAFT_664041, partial [Dendrothele bispora CBS 962.96]
MLLLYALARPLPSSLSPTATNDSFPVEVSVDILDHYADIRSCRTVEEILYSCLVVVFTCTWVAIHANIPRDFSFLSRREETKNSFEITWERVMLRNVSCMILSLLAPELIILWAMRQWFAARYIAKKYSVYGWSNAHGHFLIMGGFALFRDDEYKFILQDSDSFDEDDQKVAKDIVEILGHEIDFKTREENSSKESTTTVKCLLELLILLKFISITKREIDSKSKRDVVTKTLPVAQTLWFITQCVARASERLAITDLEISTLAFTLLNIATYILWKDKPQRIRYPMRI